MSPRWLIGFTMLFIMLSVLSNVIEQADPLAENEMSVLSNLTAFQRVTGTDIFGVVISGIGALGSTLTGIWQALSFDYSFLKSSATDDNFFGVMTRYIIFVPCTIGMLFCLALAIRSAYVS